MIAAYILGTLSDLLYTLPGRRPLNSVVERSVWPMINRSHNAFTLVELLVVIAVIAVLLAILMPAMAGAKSIAKRLRCSSNLGAIGKAFSMYLGAYDSALPTLEWYKEEDQSIHHYYAYRRADPYDASRDIWIHMGCLYGQGLIDNPKTFYCPATEEWEAEYKRNVNPPTYKWGERPFESSFLKAIWGYTYWPMSKKYYNNATEYAAIHPSSSQVNYSVNFPRSAFNQSNLNQKKVIAADYTFHYVKGSGWNLDALFPDGHVLFQKQPVNAQGLGLWHEPHQWPSSVMTASSVTWVDAGEQARNVPAPAPVVQFMYQLQP
jgi:prepilin-type N-terminal cleavage/methylation domain-containing protein